MALRHQHRHLRFRFSSRREGSLRLLVGPLGLLPVLGSPR